MITRLKKPFRLAFPGPHLVLNLLLLFLLATCKGQQLQMPRDAGEVWQRWWRAVPMKATGGHGTPEEEPQGGLCQQKLEIMA
jgi:hypothetical protein